jgi:hypothetical protein
MAASDLADVGTGRPEVSMRIVTRIIGALLISCLGAAPLGVSAEGYVCASGMRMVHGTAPSACAHCRAGEAAKTRAAFERPCCTYVSSAALPPVLNVSASASPAAHRALTAVPPGMTTTAGFARSLGDVPQYESGSSGSSPPPVTLQRALLLRN